MRIENLARVSGLTAALLGITGVTLSEHYVETNAEANKRILEAHGHTDVITGCQRSFAHDKIRFRNCLQKSVDEFAAQNAKTAICVENNPDKALVLFDESLKTLRKKAAKGKLLLPLHSLHTEAWQLANDRKALAGKLRELCRQKLSNASLSLKRSDLLCRMR